MPRPERGGPATRPALRRPVRLARWTVLALGLTLALVLGAAPAPVVSGPRPSLGFPLVPTPDRFSPPAPHIDDRFATLPFVDVGGRPGTWVLSDTVLPLRFVVEREAAERYGLDRIQAALGSWNGIAGSRFGVEIVDVVDGTAGHKVQDNVNRVFIDRRDCEERYLARAHLYPGRVETYGVRSVAWVDEVDIGLCERLTPERLPAVLRHEVAHVAGLGHLCDATSDCWVPQMGEDNRCRVMSPAAYPCQEPTTGDAAGLIYLHPRLPRIAGDDRLGTAAAVSYLSFPDPRGEERVILTDVDAPPDVQAAAATLAGLRSVPHLLVDEDCVSGPEAVELNRVVAMDATATLVGEVSGGCEDALALGWRLTTERLRDLDEVTEAVIAEVGEPRRLILTQAPDAGNATVPDAALAVPAAVGLGAPILPQGRGEVSALVRDVLDRHPSITGVVIVGDERRISATVESTLEDELGVRVRRLSALDSFEVAEDLSRMHDVYGPDPVEAVIIAADRGEDALAAAQLAAYRRGALIPVFAGSGAPDVRVAELLRSRVTAGYVIGGPQAISIDLHLALSRAVDLAP